MNSRQLSYVIAVAQEKSFSLAAKRLMISQPSLSQYIQKLEQELGIELFERGKHLNLTYAGEIYIKMAHKILKEEEQVKEILGDLKNEKIGRIIVGVGFFNAVHVLPYVIREMKEEFPNIDIIIKEDVEPKLQELAARGELDLLITTLKLPNQEEQFEYKQIMEEDFLLAVPKSYLINKEFPVIPRGEVDEIDIALCKDFPFIVLEPNTVIQSILDNTCKKAGFIPKKSIQCVSVEVAHALARMNLGICLLPSAAVCYGGFTEELNYYRIKQCNEKRTIWVAYDRGCYLSKAMKCFIEIILNF